MTKLCAVLGVVIGSAAYGDITLVGRASIPGDALDKSGLTDVIGSDVPQNRLGGFGSAIDYTSRDDLYVACTDRGPGDGAAPFRPRFHTFRIAVEPGSAEPVRVELVSTTLFTTESGARMTGLASAWSGKDQRLGMRFDPEGVRVSKAGTMWVSDEYGPWIDEFSVRGERLRRLSVPAKFMVRQPGDGAENEMPPVNVSGRQSNRGLEGLAIGPDGALWAMVQGPLIQDHAVSADGTAIGVNLRLLRLDPGSGASAEFVYRLDAAGHGVSEVLAINERELLVLERDGKAGNTAAMRSVYRVDVSGATDVSGIRSLPARMLPGSITAVRKTEWLDLMDPKFGLAGAEMPEKIEGLTFGPSLADGRRTLIVTSDNDLKMESPSWFWVFAVDAMELK